MSGNELIRNFAFVGHGSAGKTSTADAILFKAKAVARQGKVDDKTSNLDVLDDEKERKYSLYLKLGRLEWKKRILNLLDTPGKPDFIGEVASALPAVETAVVTVPANSGIQVNTRNVWKMAEQRGKARAILVTKIDAENVHVDDVMKAIKATFGDRCVPVNYPDGEGTTLKDVYSVIDLAPNAPKALKTWRDTLVERAVEADDKVMEKYLETMEIDDATFKGVLKKAVHQAVVVPVLFASVTKDKGLEQLLDFIAEYFPSPVDVPFKGKVYDVEQWQAYQRALKKQAEQQEQKTEEEVATTKGAPSEKKPAVQVVSGAAVPTKEASEPPPLSTRVEPPKPLPTPSGFVGQVFKTMIDPFVGRLTFIRVISGELTSDGMIYNPQTGKSEKNTGFNVVTAGMERKKIDKATAGDIVVLQKMDVFHTHDTLTDGAKIVVEPLQFPEPMAAKAIFPKTQKDVDKLGDALRKICEEDLTLHDRTDPITHERVLTGMSDLHVGTVIERMKNRYKVEVEAKLPKVPYNETITAKATGSYRHKKQSGGSGEFGEVHLDIVPTERGKGVEFEDGIVGMSIDRQYIPAVEKGVRDQCLKGILAGFPVVDIHVRLFDGKTHPVDSKDRAFQKAARECMKELVPKAKPKLLEPVMEMEITVPVDNVGDIMADLSGARRGRVLDQTTEGNFATLRANVPLAEVQTYSQTLQSVTGGEGFFTMKMSHYDVVPDMIAQQVIAKYKKADEDDKD